MTLEAMAVACNGVLSCAEELKDKEITAVTTDSRKVEKDGLFIAIKGEKVDGHDYIESCFKAGALCVITERDLPDAAGAYIKVESSLQALKDLALLYRNNLNIKVVGITGSVGKTSTKESIYAVLSERYRTLKTLGNFNNEIGLPLTIFRLTPEDEVAVLEMGISDFGEMTRLTKIAQPDICVITNIGLCHLENLGTRDGILKAKTEIFKSMNPEGYVILNGDDDKLITVSDVYGKVPMFYGIENRTGAYAENIVDNGLEGTRFTIRNLKADEGTVAFEPFTVNVPVPGHHMVYNALAAAMVGAVMEMTPNEIQQGISNLKTIAGRNNIIKENGLLILDDCYNANPVSMKASLDVLDTAKGRKVAILGDMFELGKDELSLHYSVGEYFAAKNIDMLITVGEMSKQIAKGAADTFDNNKRDDCLIKEFDDLEDLYLSLGQLIETGDNILVKASHGMKFADVVAKLKTVEHK